jgi:transposase
VGPEHAQAVLDATNEAITLMRSTRELAFDLAIEARLAPTLFTEIHELEQRIQVMRRALDPAAILRSVPGVGSVNAAQVLGPLGDPGRFRSLAGARSACGNRLLHRRRQGQRWFRLR